MKTTPRLSFGPPPDFPRIGRTEANPDTGRRNVDAMPDGEHLMGVAVATALDSGASQGSQITVVLNWFDEVRQRVPVK